MIICFLLILFGDGIGFEVMVEVCKVIDWFQLVCGIVFDVFEDLVGGVVYDKYGKFLVDDIMVKVQVVDVVLLGVVGGLVYDNLDFSVKLECGLLCLCKEMDLYVNLCLV